MLLDLLSIPQSGGKNVKTCLKKNLNAPRPSEHPPVRGKKCQNVTSSDLSSVSSNNLLSVYSKDLSSDCLRSLYKWRGIYSLRAQSCKE